MGATIRDNLQLVQERIEKAAQRAGRKPEEIILVAVTKTVEVPRIWEAISAGVQHIGENRVQEAQEKIKDIGNKVTWHMIGHLQTNKVKQALDLFQLIHSVDSLKLARELSKRAEAKNQTVDILIQINLAHEETKFGFPVEKIQENVQEIAALPRLAIKGLMTIPPLAENPEHTRPYFKKLREISEELRKIPQVEMKFLSMGMTNDFEVAIEEGANMVRIGTAIFGPRPWQ
jgi:pyridoxal phosphate enzyme (YggS family)